MERHTMVNGILVEGPYTQKDRLRYYQEMYSATRRTLCLFVVGVALLLLAFCAQAQGSSDNCVSIAYLLETVAQARDDDVPESIAAEAAILGVMSVHGDMSTSEEAWLRKLVAYPYIHAGTAPRDLAIYAYRGCLSANRRE